jgi:hypothetical protein
MSRVITKEAAAVSVGASQTDCDISSPFTPKDPWHVSAMVLLSAASETTGITFSLKDSFDGGTTFNPVGSESQQALVKKTFTAGTREVSTITFPAVAGATQADYVHFTAQDGTKYAVWLDIDAAGTAPTGALYTAADSKIEVNVTTGQSAAQVATAVVAAIGTSMNADFTLVDNLDGTVTCTQVYGGAVTDPVPKNADDSGAGSITVTVGTAGSNGAAVNLSTNTLTVSSHGWLTGDRVIASGSLPGGITSGTTYYVIKTDANNLKLAASQDNAMAGTAVDLVTHYGYGTCTLYQAAYEIHMYREDATDAAQLPIWGCAKVVANTGASDSCTVSAVYLHE